MPESSGRVTFIEEHRPVLGAGEYQVSVSQEVVVGSTTETYVNTTSFAVVGQRFALDPVHVDSVFPPARANGAFDALLPHIVLRRRTLPWERSASENPGSTGAPWLALLSFDESDPAPDIVSGCVGQILDPKDESVLSYPGATSIEVGQHKTDPCTFIDVELARFDAIVPCIQDLRWLAHARRLSTEKKVDDQVAPANGAKPLEETDYAVVVGNRLPCPGKQHTVHLVSLERMEPWLLDENGKRSKPIAAKKIRLVSLFNWTFHCSEKRETFAEVLGRVADKAGPLALPFVARADDDPAVTKSIREAFSRGYVPLDHTFREGGNAPSWYRGPFVQPPLLEKLRVPLASADAALRYDPDTGMFDASYAAAWQLGRLLALQNRDVATALHAWKSALRIRSRARQENTALSGRLQSLHTAEAGASTRETLESAALHAARTAIRALSGKDGA